MNLGHAPVVEEFSPLHGVTEVSAPVIRGIDIPHRSGDAAFRHHGVRLTQERLANHSYAGALSESLNRRTKPRASGADDQHIMFVSLEFIVHRSRKSLIAPLDTRRT